MKCAVGIFPILCLVTNNILDVNSLGVNRRLRRLFKWVFRTLDHGALITCKPLPEPTPDFAAAGKRISEQKCDEYKWNVKSREHQSKRNVSWNNCPDGYGPAFRNDDDDAAPGQDPNLVAIGWKDEKGWLFKCGGSLVSDRYVLTAAHCLNGNLPKPEIVRFGDKNVFDNAKIKKVIVHPDFVGENLINDIGLIELEEAVTFKKNVLPACLWKDVDVSSLGSFANATGWGPVHSAKPEEDSPKPKKASLKIIDSTKCEELIKPVCGGKHCEVKDTQICAEGFVNALIKKEQWNAESRICASFSGDPLQIRISDSPEGAMNYVIGITSYSVRCNSVTPDVYTRVSSYLDWIESIVWPKNKINA